jgi:hypothetical protein
MTSALSNVISVTVQASGGGGGLPYWLANANGAGAPAQLNQWVTVPESATLNSVSSQLSADPPPVGSGSFNSLVNDWCGACLRPQGSYYLLHGGGHGGYGGNDVYALKLSDDHPGWVRQWGPTVGSKVEAGDDGSITPGAYFLILRYADGPSGLHCRLDPYGSGYSGAYDGNPSIYHTLTSLVWDEKNDRMMRTCGGSYARPSGYAAAADSLQWGTANTSPTDRTPGKTRWNAGSLVAPFHPDPPTGGGQGASCYNPVTGDIYCWYLSRRYIWRAASNTWDLITHYEGNQLEYANMAYEPARTGGGNCMWTPFGHYQAAGFMYRWNCGNNTTEVISVPGTPQFSYYCDIVYDEALKVFWITHCPGQDSAGATIELYKFDPVALTCTPAALYNSTKPTETSDTTVAGVPAGRTWYVRELKGIVVKPNFSAPVYFMRTAA